MNPPYNRVNDLLERIDTAAASRHEASERYALHQKLSLCTVAYLALALVLIPLVQALNIPTGIAPVYLFAAEAVIAVLVLVYGLLIGEEKFIAQETAMRDSAFELERLGDRVVARQKISDADYAALTKEYFDILDRYAAHQPLDYLLTLLKTRPEVPGQWPSYLLLWVRAQLLRLCHYLHYAFGLAFTVLVFGTLLGGIGQHVRRPAPDLHPGAVSDRSAASGPQAPGRGKPLILSTHCAACPGRP
ncbi:MAG TPA: SLATT domain-containing protein [Noviherbaspirillum sp.]|uniref:SLATT domain-containing protein n=1 Tax=Noviherbaspirillum sp. TaxID=1926288 RepID=UPI002F94350C